MADTNSHFARVAYRKIYPGIDLVFYFRAGQLEYDVELQPGADAAAVKVRIEGAKTALNANGDVVISGSTDEILRIKKPVAYQPEAGRHAVPARYVAGDGVVTLSLGEYDHSRTLIIDPALAFSTFLLTKCTPAPDPCSSFVSDIAVDGTGIYVTGGTNASSFPFIAGQPPATVTSPQSFIVKLDPSGSKVLYSTFLACSNGFNIAVDSKGAAYVSGSAAFNRCS